MRELAAFVSSDMGRTYGAVCERWGIDPGAIMDDDVMAFNLRAGLAMTMSPEPEEDDEATRHARMVETARRGSQALEVLNLSG